MFLLVGIMRNIHLPIFALLLYFLGGGVPAWAQIAPPARVDDATQLEDVDVVRLSPEATARAFVSAVGAPAPGRKLAIWQQRVCVGVGGMRPEPGQILVDRISDWAVQVGLEVGPPGCRPNIFIVATNDGAAAARELVAARSGDFRTGVSGADRGATALEIFQHFDKLVRWWQTSVPIDENTLQPIVPLRGQPPFAAGPGISRPSDLRPYGRMIMPSRLTDGTADQMQQVIIVVDAAALQKVSFSQLADYISMVALAQVNADAVPSVPSILGLFEGHQEMSLTSWDRAYLRALYGTRQSSRSNGANRSTLARALLDDLGTAR